MKTANNFRCSGEDVRHCKEDALKDKEFERLVQSCHKLDDDYFASETRLIVFLAGRMGMRAGEIAHLQSEWIDWRREIITIPRHYSCDNGRNGGICGHCRSAAKQMTEYHNSLSLSEAESMMWAPKTESSAREIPFTTTRASLAVEDYFDQYDSFQASQSVINRRVNRVAEKTNCLSESNVYPHCLRATCASYLAARGINVVALKSLMGWADFSVALKYIQDSGKRTSEAINSIVN